MKRLIATIVLIHWVSGDVDLQVHTNLQAGDKNVCPYEHVEEVVLKEPCLRAYTKFVRTRKIGCNGLLATCTVREPKTVYFRTYRNVTRKRRQSEYKCCPGYEQVEGKCQKPNCSSDVCHNGGSCISNSHNSSRLCLCPSGFQGSTCQYDVNECLVNNGDCHHACINTIGSYFCSCFPGFELGENSKCVDIDECSVDNGGCSSLCVNVEGGFRCDCPAGEQLGHDGRSCVNQTSCAIGNGGCEHVCEEHENRFLRCRCHAGFKLSSSDKRSCHLIDACAVNHCQHYCRSHNGRARCECKPNYVLAYDQKSCTTKDMCAINNGGCEQECIQTGSEFRCGCRSGFELAEDQHSCRVEIVPMALTAPDIMNTLNHQTTGIEELSGLKSCILQPEGSCHKLCMDFSTGQTFCSCRSGYFLNVENLHTCQDINECLIANGGCDHECINAVGSFQCTCNPGYLLTYDQKSCEDVDECLNNEGDCQHVCRNTPGSFHCDCFDGYTLAEDGKTCKEMDLEQYKFQYDSQQQASTTRRTSERVHRMLAGSTYSENSDDVDMQFVEFLPRKVCESSTFGKDCKNTCDDCQNGQCNDERTKCECNPGFRGILCERPCVNGTFGANCLHKCNCNGHKCNPINGHCLNGVITERVLPDYNLPAISTLPLLKIYPLASAQYACENSHSSAKTRWFFDTRANLSAINLFKPTFDENSVSNLTAGEYLCQTRNPAGQQQAAVRLVVPECKVVDGESPTARVEHKHLHLKHGEKRRIQCHTSGSPMPKVRWIGPDGFSLPMDVLDLGDGVLEISNARKFEHEGVYKCQSANLAGMVSDHITLTVGPSLTIKITPNRQKIFVKNGSPLEIKCEAFGEPQPDVLWNHDAGPTRGDRPDGFTPVKISEEFILHSSIGFGNTGFYSCNASNQFTTVTRDIYVEVVDAAQHEKITIVGGTSQRFPIGRSAQILCVASGVALIDRLEWKRNGQKLSSGLSAFNEPGLMYFETFQSTEEGVYECQAYHQGSLVATRSVFVYAEERRGHVESDSSVETLASLQVKLAKCKRKYAKSLKRKHNRQFMKRHTQRTKRHQHYL